MEKTSAETDWAVTANRYVAYLDIMGFKDMVLRTTHDEIYKMMINIAKKIKFNANIDWMESSIKLIKATTYSDSIIIYSKDDSLESFKSLIFTVSALTCDLLTDAIPHKGAVAFGTMTLDTDNSIFFGQPLIDAYLLQEELAFYGIILHATSEQEMTKIGSKSPYFVKHYSCPFKNGNSLHMVIPPLFTLSQEPKHQEYMEKLFLSFDKLRFKTSGYLRKYIDNTELYLNIMKKSLSSSNDKS
ncbi:MAG: hypothetical protein Q8M86_01885 [Syntrophales bacterium]|nr:hypothetical protein [Syntrophales bacterium]